MIFCQKSYSNCSSLYISAFLFHIKLSTEAHVLFDTVPIIIYLMIIYLYMKALFF